MPDAHVRSVIGQLLQCGDSAMASRGRRSRDRLRGHGLRHYCRDSVEMHAHGRIGGSINSNNSLREGAMSRRVLGNLDIPLELPAELTQARRFGKARSAQSTALLEDYVELIADLLATTGEARPTDIARRLGVSHPTAINTITRLKRKALATARPYRGVFLTEKGEALARRVRARHRLVVEMLLALGIPAETAEADAEGIEHHVSEITLKAFAQFLQARKQM
jgi:DtxR family transcriptional regulator, manganese transport regulator